MRPDPTTPTLIACYSQDYPSAFFKVSLLNSLLLPIYTTRVGREAMCSTVSFLRKQHGSRTTDPPNFRANVRWKVVLTTTPLPLHRAFIIPSLRLRYSSNLPPPRHHPASTATALPDEGRQPRRILVGTKIELGPISGPKL